MPLDQPHLSSSEDIDQTTMSFGDHLDELRSRLIKALIVPFLISFITFWQSGNILKLLTRPLIAALESEGLREQLQVLAPTEAILTQIKIALISAIILSLPWILWQAWKFIRPGLYRKERRFVYFLVPGSALLTVLGVCVLYFIMLPLVLLVLVQFGTKLDDDFSFEALTRESTPLPAEGAQPGQLPVLTHPPEHLEIGMMWLTPRYELLIVFPAEPEAEPQVDEQGVPIPPALEIRRVELTRATSLTQTFQLTSYVNFVILLALGMVIAFQTPLVILLLNWVDIVRVGYLKQNRRKILFICGVLGAVLTPQDPWSMIGMMLLLYMLFELGIILAWLFPASRVAGGIASAAPRREKDETGA